MPQATWSTQAGIAKETTYGTAVPPTAFLPVTSVKVDDKIGYIEDKAWRGAPVDTYSLIPGFSTSDIEINGPVFPDTIGFILGGLFGTDTLTGSTAPYAHAFSLNNGAVTPSYTITDAVNGTIRRASGVRFSEVEFTLDPNAIFTFQAKGTGRVSASTTRPTASYSALSATAGWNFVPTVGGTALSNVESASVTISRTLTQIPTLNGQTLYNVYPGLMTVSGKFTMVMEDETQLLNYLNGTQVPLDLAYSIGSGTTNSGVQIHCTQCQYTAATRDRSKEYVELQVDFTALGNITDGVSGYSPAKVTVSNAQATNTYC